MWLSNFHTYVICFLILGTIFIPSDIFVDNYNLPRNYFFCIICYILPIVSFIIKKRLAYRINTLSCLALIIVCTSIIRNGIFNLQFLFIIAFASLLFVLSQETSNKEVFNKFIIILLNAENIICLLQFLNIIECPINLFKATGSFENPNTYGLFAVMCFPFALKLYNDKKRNYYLFTIISTAIFVALLGCRTAFACICFIILYNSKVSSDIKKRCFLLFFILSLSLFFLKINSSLGRLLIIISTTLLISSIPLEGLGYQGFTHEYMHNQANILSSKIGYIFSGLEDNPMHPLNEFLQYICNIGLIGIPITCILVYYIIKSRKNYDSFLYSGIIATLVVSNFTYSLRYAFTWTFLAIYLSQSIKYNYKFTFQYIRAITSIVCPMLIFITVKNINFEIKWKNIWNETLTYGINSNTENEYSSLYKVGKSNPYFLFNYASILHHNEKYARSNTLLKEYEEKIVDYHGTMLKADNYYAEENYKDALLCYKTANMMCPTRFIPLWKQIKCYRKQNDVVHCRELAYIIINKGVKIDSYNIRLIKKQCQIILSSNEK